MALDGSACTTGNNVNDYSEAITPTMKTSSPLYMRRRRAGRFVSGFTLVELMVSVLLSSMLIGSLMSGFIFQRKNLHTTQQVIELQQNARSAMDLLANDLTMVGYGINVSQYQFLRWIDWVPGMTNNPTLIEGVLGAPDEVLVAGAFEAPVAQLAVDALAGSTALQLTAMANSLLNTNAQRVAFLGRSETIRVVAVTGNIVTFSTDPLVNGVGLKFDHPAGAPLERVHIRSYQVLDNPAQYPFRPYLAMTDSLKTYAFEWSKMLAGDIEDLQFRYDNYSVVVEVTSRASSPDYRYLNTARSDHYRRQTLVQKVLPRNARTNF